MNEAIVKNSKHVIVAVIVCGTVALMPAFASEPGQPLDCSDWISVLPGLTCSESPFQCGANFDGGLPCTGGSFSFTDNERHLLYVKQTLLPTSCGFTSLFHTAVMMLDLVSGVETVAGYFEDRCGGDGCFYRIGPRDSNYVQVYGDNTSGSLVAILNSNLGDGGGTNCAFPPLQKYRPIIISGFTALFDVLQSFTPEPAALGFRVPLRPEGLAGADHFDTYWGTLTKPLDFTQAHPLQCGYPVAAPHVGDYLTVADTVPTPAPGQGVYYVTSATYQGATRYGRKTTAGHLSGRDPAVLPVCGP